MSLDRTAAKRLFAAGFLAAAAQIVYLREYLALFAGNELVLAAVYAVWLAAGALGSIIAARSPLKWFSWAGVVLAIVCAAGVPSIRAVRLLFGGGIMVPALLLPAVIILTGAPLNFVCGAVFGLSSRSTLTGATLFRLENAGAAAGLLIASVCVVARVPNSGIAAIAVVPAIFSFGKRSGIALALSAILLWAADLATVQWKYGGLPVTVSYGREGEAATLDRRGERSEFLNCKLYRSQERLPLIEEAVHVPLSLHPHPRRVLLVRDRGHMDPLSLYNGLSVTCLEPEPLLRCAGCIGAPPESFKPPVPFDIVIIGAGAPDNIAAGRFYTVEFFRRMKSMMTDTGLLAFSLEFNENYLSPGDRALKERLSATLNAVFPYVKLYPGASFTFAGAAFPLPDSIVPRVTTAYFGPVFPAYLTKDKLAAVNALPARIPAPNTVLRPSAVPFELSRWLQRSGTAAAAVAIPLAALALIAVLFVPRTAAALSVGTGGLATGAYTIALMLLFQAYHGTLYGSMALLAAALSAGFTLGSFARRFPCSDLITGLYAAATLSILACWAGAPLWAFMTFHAGMGAVAGAQFVTRKGTSWAGLYGADLCGGIFGMGLCATVFLPATGMYGTALILGAVKVLAEVVRWRVVADETDCTFEGK